MEQLPVKQAVQPTIIKNEVDFVWNFEEVKEYLETHIEKYCGLTATEENLPDFEKACREVVRLRTTLTKFKADGKRKLKEPADRFAKQCDELIAVVTDVEMPIKSQIEQYEGDRKAKLAESITREFQAKASVMGLDMKYWQDFQMVPRWFNKTAKWSDTCNAIDSIIKELLTRQKADEDAEALVKAKVELVKSTIALMNQKYNLKTPVTGDDVFGDEPIDKYSTEEIQGLIEDAARVRKEIEDTAKQKTYDDAPILPSEPFTEPVKESTHEITKTAETDPFAVALNPFEVVDREKMDNPFVGDAPYGVTFSDGAPYPKEWSLEFVVERDQEGAATDIVKNFVHAMKFRGIEVKVIKDE